VTLDADAVVGVSGEDVAELRDLLDRIRLQDRAVGAEQQRRLEIHQDAVFGASRVGDLPKPLLLLVEIVADGAPSDASDDRTDGRAFPSAAGSSPTCARRCTPTCTLRNEGCALLACLPLPLDMRASPAGRRVPALGVLAARLGAQRIP